MRGLALIGLAAALVAGACATTAEREATRIRASLQESQPALEACTSRLHSAPQYAVIGSKLVVWDGEPTLAQQTNATKATADEAQMLLELHEQYLAPCRRARLEAAGKGVSAWVPLIVDAYTKQDAVFAEVVKGKVTYGDANRQLMAIKAEGRTKFEAVNREVVGALEKSHNTELARRQAAAASMQQWIYQQQVLLQNQQMINAMNQPRVTNCQYVGAYLSCTTF